VFVLIWLGAPFSVAVLLSYAIGVGSGAAYKAFAVGLVLAFAFVLVVYLRAPPDYQHSHGDEDGQMFLGRWWEPNFVFFLIGVAYLSWALGVLVGLLVRILVGPTQKKGVGREESLEQ
jgi:hypothetical protein